MKFSFRALSYAVLLTVAMAAVATPVIAHKGATGVVKERMMLMSNLGKSMKALAGMLKGKTPYDAASVKQHARQLADHGNGAITKLFPEGSLVKPSEARPEIWQDWEKFKSLAAQLTQAAQSLEQAAGATPGTNLGGPSKHGMAAPGPVRAAFRNVGRACSACHKVFRVKK